MKKNETLDLKGKKAVVLMSGGLDSIVALSFARSLGLEVPLGLTFDYGQRAAEAEIEAAGRILKSFNIIQKVIKLPFLDEISTSSLNNKEDSLEFEKIDEKSASKVWVPNRNGLFLNVAACFAEAKGLNYIIFGANKEEGETFPDNTKAFVERINAAFEYSILDHGVKVFAPLINSMKHEIIELGVELNVDFGLIKSCYAQDKKLEDGRIIRHCGKCESCLHLKNAILKTGNKDLINKLF